MTTRDVSIRMPSEMAAEVERLARAGDMTPGRLVRRAVARELRRLRSRAARAAPCDPQTTKGLAMELARAEGWADLDRRLARRGCRIAPTGGGVALFDMAGRKLCKGSEVGAAYRDLVRRFREGMPGHPHGAVGLDGPGADPLLE